MWHNVFVGVVLLVWLSPIVLAGVILYRINKSNEHPHVCIANSVGVCRCGHNVVE